MDAPSFEGLSPIIASGVATFFVGLAAVNKWFDLQKNETTQVAIIQADRDDWKEKAEAFEIKAEQAWSTVNKLNSDLTELKISNARMSEQLDTLRQRNGELTQQIQEFMRSQNARANS